MLQISILPQTPPPTGIPLLSFLVFLVVWGPYTTWWCSKIGVTFRVHRQFLLWCICVLFSITICGQATKTPFRIRNNTTLQFIIHVDKLPNYCPTPTHHPIRDELLVTYSIKSQAMNCQRIVIWCHCGHHKVESHFLHLHIVYF